MQYRPLDDDLLQPTVPPDEFQSNLDAGAGAAASAMRPTEEGLQLNDNDDPDGHDGYGYDDGLGVDDADGEESESVLRLQRLLWDNWSSGDQELLEGVPQQELQPNMNLEPQPEVAAGPAAGPVAAGPVAAAAGENPPPVPGAADSDEVVEPSAKRPRKAAEERLEPRSALDALTVLDASGNTASAIKFKPQNKDLFCKCSVHFDCSKTRTTNPAKDGRTKTGQGRPLGFLSAWVCMAGSFSTKQEHQGFKPSYDQRLEARLRLEGQGNFQHFANLERKRKENEGIEPKECP